ncbi:alpha-xenorhabdolysin family binary toxin subunit B, partial [Pseudomonas syringae group genomosp. 7]|uniref:alpha-xenorhabdolysin family binary toxin subunit B n=1 Tax=Pseudomonas syringae group genomosp. 7 TaxID=251699 RepID=UPI00376F6221
REAKENKAKLDELTGLAQIDERKALWVKEARKVYQSLHNFLDQIASHPDSSALISQHVEHLKAYIKSLYDVTRAL